ncbi:hypothetical protein [Roseateles koreensis]|uniref:Ubiquinone biosynthesis protein UbiJ n=1 Tax=Roseateles koreensis TaxID=2987526 RepID=A0ABT5KV11_9BURK|nr:hypothetical protein [Roseateles koreensis]MDC8786672.1 hypothetical protein [Roseateles koreensis]
MIQEWLTPLTPAVQDRTILLLNHVISRESHAMARLSPFAGRSVVLHLHGWPALLPPMPDLALGITPAGLFERLDALVGAEEAGAPAALRIELDASNPALMALGALTGEKPRVTVQGDAALAGEINWLTENLRWDIEDDLANVVGPAAAHQLARFGKAAASAMAGLARTAANFQPGGRGAA